jgi:hypothetical protein
MPDDAKGFAGIPLDAVERYAGVFSSLDLDTIRMAAERASFYSLTFELSPGEKRLYEYEDPRCFVVVTGRLRFEIRVYDPEAG